MYCNYKLVFSIKYVIYVERESKLLDETHKEVMLIK